MSRSVAADAQQLAEACARAMWADDPASQSLGMKIDAIGPGTATLSMEIVDSMVNGHGLCHGGFIFTLADSTFAFACNTYNQRTVAQHCQITFLAPGRLGDRLVAHGKERFRAGRNGVYDITVTNQDGSVIAEFRGNSRTIDGRLLDEEQQARSK